MSPFQSMSTPTLPKLSFDANTSYGIPLLINYDTKTKQLSITISDTTTYIPIFTIRLIFMILAIHVSTPPNHI